MRILPLIIGIVPGFGHIWIGMYRRGVLLFFLFLNGVNGYLVGIYLWERPGREAITWSALVLAVGIWIFSFVNILRHARKKPKEEGVKLTEKERALLVWFLTFGEMLKVPPDESGSGSMTGR